MEITKPTDEDERLAALRRYNALEGGHEKSFEDLAGLAAKICGTPVSFISLVDEDTLTLKAAVGMPGVETLARKEAFCSHAILEDDVMIVPDASGDARFADYPIVRAENGLKFYAGSPVTTEDGHNLGTICVLDHNPRGLDEAQLEAMRALSRQVMSQLELRRNLDELASITRKAVALENLVKKYTSRSVWEKADLSVSSGRLEISDEEVDKTYLFIDVVSFTRLSESLGSAGTVELLNVYFKPMVDVITDHDGDIDKFVGDQIFGIFARPRDAVRAALRIRAEVNELNRRRKEQGLLTLDITMGMSHGSAIRANVGGSDRRDNTLIGNVVNIAARLQGACEPNGILITDDLYDLVKQDVRVEKTNRYKLKNLAEVIRAHYITDMEDVLTARAG